MEFENAREPHNAGSGRTLAAASSGNPKTPFFLCQQKDGERSPNLPHASGTPAGLSRQNMTPENLARAFVLGVLNSLADAIDVLRRLGGTPDKVLLIGGGSKSKALRQAAASIFNLPVEVPGAGNTSPSGRRSRQRGPLRENCRLEAEHRSRLRPRRRVGLRRPGAVCGRT
ncbi:FGGY-family carbohydrate kinase [Arthrobacter sp. MPF02]|uniref:FGGY-family carbohydrate kinase n=1 Tax=Arthrobacter sp. MPF02 TaxID=3388492 RepID=UPI0039847713